MDPATTGAATPYRPNSLLEEMRTVAAEVSRIRCFMQELARTVKSPPVPAPALFPPVLAPPVWESPVPAPDPYDGTLGKCQGFLLRCQRVFDRQPQTFDSDGSKVSYVVGLLRGRALDWAVRTLGFDRPNAVPFVDFVEDLRRVFDPPVDSDYMAKHLLSRRRGQASVGEHSVVRPSPAPRIRTAFRPSPYPAAASEPQRTLVPVPAASAPQPAPVAAASEPQPAPVAASEQQRPPVAASEQQRPPVAASQQQRPPVAASEQQRPPVAASEQQRPPVAASEHQRPPGPASEQQRPPGPAAVGPASYSPEPRLRESESRPPEHPCPEPFCPPGRPPEHPCPEPFCPPGRPPEHPCPEPFCSPVASQIQSPTLRTPSTHPGWLGICWDVPPPDPLRPPWLALYLRGHPSSAHPCLLFWTVYVWNPFLEGGGTVRIPVRPDTSHCHTAAATPANSLLQPDTPDSGPTNNSPGNI
ncbi:nuclear factor I/Xb isoform X5 [Anarhichas minor]|uniref:nuclear factor I/Xb isoform X5 n=1 Tax=Anarhichas minor TaxID=65739 RepID=UPI003F7402D1